MQQEFKEGAERIGENSLEEMTVKGTYLKSGQVGDNRTGIHNN